MHSVDTVVATEMAQTLKLNTFVKGFNSNVKSKNIFDEKT